MKKTECGLCDGEIVYDNDQELDSLLEPKGIASLLCNKCSLKLIPSKKEIEHNRRFGIPYYYQLLTLIDQIDNDELN